MWSLYSVVKCDSCASGTHPKWYALLYWQHRGTQNKNRLTSLKPRVNTSVCRGSGEIKQIGKFGLGYKTFPTALRSNTGLEKKKWWLQSQFLQPSMPFIHVHHHKWESTVSHPWALHPWIQPKAGQKYSDRNVWLYLYWTCTDFFSFNYSLYNIV